jgi:molecular chaperone DnaK (HSP70)
MDIGIDLGTTFSVIAIKGNIEPAGNYPSGMYIQECDVTIIPSPFGELTIPSAYWQNPDDPTDVRVGSEAKQAAEEGHAPILFSKRKIGTTERLHTGGRTMTAREVAAEMLKYLKQCAETYLGKPVHRAVITHPAYFDRAAVDETRQAAIDAGFSMADNDQQMIMEPVAAAISFLRNSGEQAKRVLIYDLGGGTFDVTVLERSYGENKMLAFDGNALLGGYNFDRAFIQWLLRRVRKSLEQSGRSMTFDPESNPADLSRWSRLLQLAEKVKEQLTQKRTGQMPVSISAKNILVDDEGKPIDIIDRITRDEYAKIGGDGHDEEAVLSIPEFIKTTIDCTKSAISKAGLTAGDLDRIILVGGSTYGQWIQDAVDKNFETQVDVHFSPDMCVAAGAALQAADLPPVLAGTGQLIAIVPQVDQTSPNPVIAVTGNIRRDDDSPVDAETLRAFEVLLHLPDIGHTDPAKPDDQGVVVFDDVELLEEDEPTPLRFEVLDAEGRHVCEQAFEVLYKPDDEGNTTSIMPVVPKPLYMPTASGMVMIADEGESLPTPPRRIELEQLHDESSLGLDLYQGDHKITTIEITDLPEDVGAGSEIVLEVKLTRHNVMQGMVKVLRQADFGSIDGDEESRIAKALPVKISFPPMIIPELPELEEGLKRLEARRKEMLQPEITPDPERRSEIGGLGGNLIRNIKVRLAEDLKDRQEIYQNLLSLQRLITPSTDAMRPPLANFEELVREVRGLIGDSAGGGEATAWSDRVDKFEKGGRDAYAQRNSKQWGRAFEQFSALKSEIQDQSTKPDQKPDEEPELPETSVLKSEFIQSIIVTLETQFRNKLATLQYDPGFETKFKLRGQEIKDTIGMLKRKIYNVPDDTDPKAALRILQQIVYVSQDEIEKRIREWSESTRLKNF